MKTAVESMKYKPTSHGKFGFHVKIVSNKWNPFCCDRLFRRTCLSAVLAACFDVALANPNLPQVVYGQVNISNQGKVLTVTNSPNAIINWQNFSINADETTRFVQQSANSSVLNRITGQDPSRILGSLQSNGRVFLINPNGILFGQTAQVDVHGLVASSLHISNDDFKAGKLKFADAANQSKVSNHGRMQTAQGGQVFLIAPTVENSGVITSPKGEVMLAAGHAVQLLDSANPDLHVVVSAPQNQALNLGEIIAQAGKIGIFGALVNQRGSVNANSAVMGENGKILFKATRDAMLEKGSLTSASNSAGEGGQIAVLGQRVGVTGDARLDASGQHGGGTVLLGGDYQGKNAAIMNAQQTYVGADAQIHADAGFSGDGGKVIAWADYSTQFYGSVSVRGGSSFGNGGLVETSGKSVLDVGNARIDARAYLGKSGRWLLDPSDITVVHGSSGSLSAGMFEPSSSSSIGDAEINAALNAGTDVTLQTASGTGGTGLIRINGYSDANGAVSISNQSGGARSLTLTTSGAIEVRSGATLSGSANNALNVNLIAGNGITIAGKINNFGGNTSLNSATNFSGEISHGVLSANGLFTSASGTLQDMTLSGNVNMAGATLLKGDLTLLNGATANLGSSYWYFAGPSTQKLLTTDSASINLAGGSLVGGYGAAGQTLQVDGGVTIQGYGGIYTSYASTLENFGKIVANTSGQTLSVQPTSLINHGTMKADAGSLTLHPTNWSNDGSMAVASGATLNLNIQTTTAGLGTISRTGGSVNFQGKIDNTSNTLDIGGSGPFGAGGLTSFSGEIHGGTMKSGDGTVLNINSGKLEHVTVSGTLASSGTAFINEGITLENAATLNMGNSNWYFNTSGNQHIATPGSATINLAGGSLVAGYDTNDQVVHIDSGITLQGYGALSNSQSVGIHNAGTIKANTSGQTLTIQPNGFTNSGSLQLDAGSMTLHPTYWSNTGSISVAAGSTLNLNFDTTRANLGNISRSGGTVKFSGVLDNSNGTLDIGGSGPFGAGGLSSFSGTIQGGTLKSGDGTVLTSASGILDGVTISGTLGSTGSSFIKNGMTLENGAQLNLNNGYWYVNGNGTQTLSSSGNATINLAGGGLLAGHNSTGQTLQIGSGITLQGYGSLGQYSSATIANHGTIKANTNAQTLTINPTTFNNTGTVLVNGGTLTMDVDNWIQSNTLQVDAGTLNLHFNTSTANLGTITRGGGTVNYSGVLDNSSATLDIGAAGPFGSGGLGTFSGTLKNGILKSSDSTVLNSSSMYLDGVSIQGTLATANSLFIKNGLTLDTNATLNLGSSSVYVTGSGNQHIATNGNAKISLAGGGIYAGYQSGQTLLLGSGLSLQGYGTLSQYTPSAIVNAATIEANTTGQTLLVNPNQLSNSGNIGASAGTLTLQTANWNNSGSLLASGSGLLNLHLDTTTAALGTVTRSGGTVNFSGVLDNTGATLDIGGAGPFGTGGLSALSGTLKNGIVLSSDATPLNFSSTPVLENVTISGTLNTTNTALVKNNLTLANGAQLNIGNDTLYFASSGTQHITSPGSATLQIEGGGLYAGYGVSGQTLQVDSGVTVQGYGNFGNSSPATLINEGSIKANHPNFALNLNLDTLSNTGTLDAAGGTLVLHTDNWSNAGSLKVASASKLGLHFNTSTNKIGTLARTGGEVSFYGELENDGHTLDIGGSGPFGAGGLTSLHGTIKNGIVKSGDGSVLNFSSGKLDSVTVSGALSMSGTSVIENGITLENNAHLTLGNQPLYFAGAGQQHIGTNGSAAITLNGGGLYAGYGVGGQVLHIDSGITLQGSGYVSNSSSATIVNGGVINANANGDTLYLSPHTLTNSATGVLKASAGGTLHLSPSNWSANLGQLQVGSASELDLAFNTVTANLGNIENNGGVVKLSGSIDNTAATLNMANNGTFGSKGLSDFSGSIKNGIVSGDQTAPLHASNGTLDGVTLSGKFTHSGYSLIKNGVTLADGAQIDLGNGTWYVQSAGTQHIATTGSASLKLAGGSIYGGYGVTGQTLQIDSGVSLNGYGTLTQSSSINLINAGTIEANVNGQSLDLSATSITNNGTLRVNAGALATTGFSSNAGVIELNNGATFETNHAALTNASGGQIRGHGKLDLGTASLTNLGQIIPGGDNAIGTLRIAGNFVQGAGGALKMEIGPNAINRDQLEMSGSASLNGELQISNINGYTPTNGDQFTLMSYSGTPSGNFSNVSAANFPDATVDIASAGSLVFKMPAANQINIWNFDGNGDWSDSSKWSLGHVPTATETAQIPDYASQFTIHYSSNTQTVKSVVFLGNDKLNLSGGSLSLLQNSALNSGGTLELSGSAQLAAGGDLLLSYLQMSGNPSLSIASGKNLNVDHHNQSGGVVYGPGSFTVNQAFQRTAGDIHHNLAQVNITQANGALVAGAFNGNFPLHLQASKGDIKINQEIQMTGARVTLAAPEGAIKNTGGQISASELVATARDGIGDGNEINSVLMTAVSAMQLENTGSGKIRVSNASGTPLLLSDLQGSQGFAVKNQASAEFAGFYISNTDQQITINDPLYATSNHVSNAELFAGSIVFNARSAAKMDGGDGHIVLTATGAGGIVLPSQAQLKLNGVGANSQSIRLKADSMNLAGSILGGGNPNQTEVRLSPYSEGLPIMIEASNSGAGHLSLAPADLNHITSNHLRIDGNPGSSISVNSDLNLSNIQNLWLQTDAPIAVNAAMTLAGDGQLTLNTENASITLAAAANLQAADLALSAKNGIDMSAAGQGSVGKSGGNVYLAADQIKLGTNGAISLGTGAASISGFTPGKTIDVVASRSAGGSLELPSAELQAISAKVLTIGDDYVEAGSGTLTITTPLNLSGQVETLKLASGCVAQANCKMVQQSAGAQIAVPNLQVKSAAGASLNQSVNMVDKLSVLATRDTGNYAFANGKALNFGLDGVAISGQNQRFSLAIAPNNLLTIDGTVALGNLGVFDISSDQLQINNTINAGNLQISPSTQGRAMTIGSNTCQTAPCLTVSNLHQVHTPNLIFGDVDRLPGNIHFAGLTVGGSGLADRSSNTQRIDVFSGGSISQSNSINIAKLSLRATDSVALGASNTLTKLAATAGNSISVKAGSAMEVASFASAPGVGAHSGVSATNGNVSLSSDGNLQLSSAVSAGSGISLTSLAAVTGSADISAPNLQVSAKDGIALLSTQTNSISSSNIQNDTVINNNGVLNLQGVSQAGSGKIQIVNQGAITVLGPISSDTGAIEIEAHSPLTVTGSITSTGGGSIRLVAGNSNDPSDKLTIGSSGVIASSGPVTLTAGDAVVLMAGASVPQGATIQAFKNGNPPPPTPSIGQCVADPTMPACKDVLPNINTCTITPNAEGCSVVLPSLATCSVTPSAAGCSAVLPSLALCSVTPSTAGCSVVLPSLANCMANPNLPGCSVVLPTLDTCSINPQAPGCSVVLPSLATCTITPSTAGCGVVLPSLATCSITPSTPGCSAVLPSLDNCVATPSLPGCNVVLPNLDTCSTNPQALGCSVVLPSMASCIAAPDSAGCSVVLPNLATCSVTPTALGCSVVLPNLTACIANPSAVGCAVVLPSLSMCSTNPSLPGCSVVLPTLAACLAAPSTAGCGVVLPTLETCNLNPATAGCSVTLPSMATCIAAPSTAGCAVVLPNLGNCTTSPTLPGCSVILPSLTSCMESPAAPGCSVVLPTIASCINAPSSAGCSVVLPNLSACISSPDLAGCSLILPSLNSCISAPSLPGCASVLPSLTTCASSPSTPGCSVVLPVVADSGSQTEQPLNQALSSTINVMNTAASKPSTPAVVALLKPKLDDSATTTGSPASTNTNLSANTGSETTPATTESKNGDNKVEEVKKEEKKEERKEERKDDKAVSKKEESKEPAKKMYCN